MKLSTRGEYGLRAMLYLAMRSRDDGELFHAHEISKTQDIPPHYLKQILSRLRSAGLVRSTRGPSGGHGLARAADDIRVGEIIRCLEGQLTCVDAVLEMPCAIGVGPSRCVIKDFLVEMKERIEQMLNETSLGDLARRQQTRLEGPAAELLATTRLTLGKRLEAGRAARHEGDDTVSAPAT